MPPHGATTATTPRLPTAVGVRIGWVLCSPLERPLPSTRIAVANMLVPLAQAGFCSQPLYAPPQATETPSLDAAAAAILDSGCDIVVLQKVHGPSVEALVRRLSARGVRTVYMVCDRVDPALSALTDATVVVTDHLRALHPPALQPRVHVVHDGIEQPALHKAAGLAGRGSRWQPLPAVLVASSELTRVPVIGAPPPWLKLRVVARYASGWRRLQQIRWTWGQLPPSQRAGFLRFLANPHIACVPWGAQSVYNELVRAEIGVIPIDTSQLRAGASGRPDWEVKSENRLTLQMAVGLPVVATPIPSYERVLQHGVTGYFARSRADWQQYLAALRDPMHRQAMGAAARATVLPPYSMAAQADKLAAVFRAVIAAPRPGGTQS